MNTKTVIIGAALAVCGCAGIGEWTAPEPDDAEPKHGERINCRTTKIDKLFGLDNTVLSETNRFSRIEEPGVYHITLAEPFCGCRKTTVFLDDGFSHAKTNEPVRLRSVELRRILRDEAGDAGLEEEYRATCEQVAKLLGVSCGDIELASPKAWRKSRSNQVGWGHRSNAYFELAEGQSVSVRAIDAIYVKRGEEFIMSSPAAIEVDFTYDNELFMQRIRRCGATCFPERPKATRTISVGPDCTALLSQAMTGKKAKRKGDSGKGGKNEPRKGTEAASADTERIEK